MGALAAEFVDADCLGVFLPETGDLRPNDSTLLSDLRSGRPLQLLPKWEHVPVVASMPNADAQLEAATAEARRRWSEFAWAFQSRTPQHKFSVKTPFAEGAHIGHMWVDVIAIGEGVIHGTLGNSPVHVTSLHEGDEVEGTISDIEDWVYTDGVNVQGGFSVSALVGKSPR